MSLSPSTLTISPASPQHRLSLTSNTTVHFSSLRPAGNTPLPGSIRASTLGELPRPRRSRIVRPTLQTTKGVMTDNNAQEPLKGTVLPPPFINRTLSTAPLPPPFPRTSTCRSSDRGNSVQTRREL